MSINKNYRDLQAKIKEDIRNRFSEGDYTVGNPLIIVDPYGLSPLTALVMFKTTHPTRVTLTVKGKDCFTSFTQEFPEYKEIHQIPVHGLYGGCENTVQLRVISRTGTQRTNSLKITTKQLPDDIQKIKIKAADKEKMAPGLTYTVGNNNHPAYRLPIKDVAGLKSTYTAAFDMNGDIRWFISDKTIGGIGGFCPLRNGNIVTGSEKDEGRVYFKDSCYEITHLGEIVHEYFSEGLHHHIEEMPNGNLILFGREPGSNTEEDYMIEMDREKETIVRTWRLKDIFPVHAAAPNFAECEAGGKDTHNWIHGNCVRYVSADNTFVVSGRNQDVIFKFDIDTNEIKWIFTEPGDDLPEEYRNKLLTPKDGVHTYHHGQHYITFTPNNGLLIYNNMTYTHKYQQDTEQERAEKYGHALHYRIDEDAKTFEVLWRSDKKIGCESWAPVMGSTDYLGTGHYYVNYSSINYDVNGNHLRDYFLDGIHKVEKFVFLNSPIQNSRFVEYFNDEVIFDAEYDGNFGQTYRSHRWGLYWSQKEADIKLN